jgi:glycosyltransferase involved in cell wall biosynthesis
MSTDFPSGITALLLTHNEAPNIERTLARLDWARRIVVVDSGSTDGTLEILARHANVAVHSRAFDRFADQWNFALKETGIDTDWVLALDADYLIPGEFIDELRHLDPLDGIDGYRVRFRYCILGRPIRCGAYPPVVVLYRRARGRYVQDGHTQRAQVEGRVADLESRIDHDDRKPLSRWLASQRDYARIEADHLARSDPTALSWQDRIRLLVVVAPPAMFAYVYFLRGGILDGRHGLYYALQRAYAELLLSLELLDRKLRRTTRSDAG